MSARQLCTPRARGAVPLIAAPRRMVEFCVGERACDSSGRLLLSNEEADQVAEWRRNGSVGVRFAVWGCAEMLQNGQCTAAAGSSRASGVAVGPPQRTQPYNLVVLPPRAV